MFLRLSSNRSYNSPNNGKGSSKLIKRRRRFKQTVSLETRLTRFAINLREQADQKPPGHERSSLLKRAYSAERAVDLERQLRENH
jgi:hypothetical protein